MYILTTNRWRKVDLIFTWLLLRLVLLLVVVGSPPAADLDRTGGTAPLPGRSLVAAASAPEAPVVLPAAALAAQGGGDRPAAVGSLAV